MNFESGAAKNETRWTKLRLSVARAAGLSLTEVRGLPIHEFMIILKELETEQKRMKAATRGSRK
jgi:hypothetical protein